MEEKKFGEKLSDFFAGKGFYIVLLLCAGLIAASIGLMTDGSGTDVERRGNEDTNAVYAAESPAEARPGEMPVMRLDPDAVTRPRPTVSPVPTASPTPAPPAPAPETAAAEEEDEGTITVAAASLPAVDYFIWPVNGALLRPHSTAVLGYDATMADWRTHSGLDIAEFVHCRIELSGKSGCGTARKGLVRAFRRKFQLYITYCNAILWKKRANQRQASQHAKDEDNNYFCFHLAYIN